MSHSKQDARREAWRRFYLEHYPEAVKSVGNEKQKIDAYIVSIWKTIGSKGREAYVNAVNKSAQSGRSPERPREPTVVSKAEGAAVREARAASPVVEVNASTGVTLRNQRKLEEGKASTNVALRNKRKHEQVKPETRKQTPPVERTDTVNGHDAGAYVDDDGSWPRQLTSRLSACVMLTRKKVRLSVGEVISLSVSPARDPDRGKQPSATVVKLTKNGREFARLDSSFASALGAAMQTNLVNAMCSIVQPPIGIGMFNPFYAEVFVSIEREAFVESKGNEEKTEGMSGIRMAIIRMIRDLNFISDQQTRQHETIDLDGAKADETNESDNDENFFSYVKRVEVADAKDFVPPQKLRSSLREYQKAGVRWMMNRENFGSSSIPSDQTSSLCVYPWKRCKFDGGDIFFVNAVTGELRLKNVSSHDGGPRGGILADEMGLGKTVQCIASLLQDFEEVPSTACEGGAIRLEEDKSRRKMYEANGKSVARPPAKKQKRSMAQREGQGASAMSVLMANARDACTVGGTLIICPTSLVTQWMDELTYHVEPNSLRIMAHYGNMRGDETAICARFADVVVTSYGVLASEYHSNSNNSDSLTRSGPLFKLQWRRVILDEAHTIKSKSTRWAKAAYHLQAERRWCVTGTVIHNHINDVFSLIHFLRLEPWSNWGVWTKSIADPLESKDEAVRESAMSLVRDILSSIILRRKKSTKDSDGKAIVQMTKKTVEIVSITPSKEEQEFYSALHARTKLKFNSFLSQGNVLKNYASVLEMLLRLRQACDHPYLVVKAANPRDERKYDGYQDFADSCDFDFMTTKKDRADKKGEAPESQECPICLDITDSPIRVPECGHVLCRTCLTEALQDSRVCPLCKTPTNWKDSDSSADVILGPSMKTWTSSAKIEELVQDLRERQELRDRHNQEIGKSVVFSQFSSMLDITETALQRAKISFLRIDGSVPQSKRAVILKQFGAERELAGDACNVLLLTTRTGGVGLNLTSASLAIILDIHWNPQVDAQAQDRIHRHGQTRDVHIKRYIVKDSVEEKLLEVQARKEQLAEGALEEASEGDGKQARLAELKLLFSR